jgi:ribosomal protein S18 acetylase RimI-like enzyme
MTVMVTADRTSVLHAIAATGNDIYALADLDEPIWSMSRWWVNADCTAYALCIDGFDPPVLYVNGSTTHAPAFAQLLSSVAEQLPASFYANVIVGAEHALAAFDYRPVGTYQRMELPRHVAVAPPDDEVEVLCPNDFDELRRFFVDARATASEHVGVFFTVAMLSTGLYRAIRRNGIIVAAAGVHVASQTRAVASIGNVAVHHQWRGQGLAGPVTASVVNALRAMNIERIGLNVDQTNVAAVRTYERLGFVRAYLFTEGPASRL